jgi:hypothetical protein
MWIKWISIVIICILIISLSSIYTVMFFATIEHTDKVNTFIIFFVAVFVDLVVFQVLQAFVIACVVYFSYKSKFGNQLNLIFINNFKNKIISSIIKIV